MAAVALLPAALRDKLAAAHRRVRLLRALRGVSLLLLTAVLSAGAAMLLDALVPLPSAVRVVLLAGWLLLNTAVALFGLLLPLGRRIDHDALAALVEERYPDLGERLTTAVELGDQPDLYHGSPALIALLIRETETRTGRLDFLAAVPTGLTLGVGIAAVVAVLLPVVPAVKNPGAFGRQAARFLLPWRGAPTSVPYAVEVLPGDAFAARGRPLTIIARAVPLADNAALPRTATLVQAKEDGTTTRLPMLASGEEFSFKVDNVAGNFRYRVEAGAARSDTHEITAVEPINVAGGSPAVTITPPGYARPAFEPQQLQGFHDVSALQHSKVRLEFRFTQPAKKAVLSWPGKAEKDGKAAAREHELQLADDGLSAAVELSALADGPYKLFLVGEHAIATELTGREVTVKIDQPPAVTRFVSSDRLRDGWKVEMDPTGKPKPVRDGGEALRAVMPYDSVPLDLTLADDIAVASAQVEYRVNDDKAQAEDITLKGKGTPQAAARHLFHLAGKVKEGDVLRYRIKVADNRNVPEAKLGPQVVYYPPDRWLALKVVKQAEPLRQQEILAQRDDINSRLDAIRRDLEREQRAVYRLRQDSRGQSNLLPEQHIDLKSIRQENQSIQKALRELARDAAEVPELQALADKAQDVADKEMAQAEQQMARADKEKQARQRDEQFQKADQELTAALKKLGQMRQQSDRLAQERLDQVRLEMAAQRQQQLAERAAELAAKDPIKEPAAKQEAEKLRQEQQELANELQRLTDQSEPLRSAMEQARAEQARQLAEKARELAQAERDLAQAQRDTEQAQRGDQLSELAKKQQELADRAAQLAREVQQPAQASNTRPLKPDDARRAADALKQNDLADALRNQDQAARELDRLAGDFDRAINLARDPREAARQLARLQEALRKDVLQEVKKNNGRPLPAERAKELQWQQEAIARAARQLDVPQNNREALQDQKQAAERAAQAAAELPKQNPQAAAGQMEQTRQALERLANRLPTLQQRQQQAVAQLNDLRRQQDEIARQAEQAAKQVERQDPSARKTRDELAKKLADAARRQAEAAERLANLDAPNQEARKERAEEALNRALADLLDARPQDVAASQQQARRELERLQEALSGRKPADEQARELARRQEEVAREAARVAADPKATPQQKEQLQRQQQQIAREAEALKAPEAPQRQAEAARAAKEAEQAANAKPADAGTQRKMQESAQALDRLARQMEGRESDAARAERLARQQAEAAAEAERQAKQGQPAKPDQRQQQQRIAEEAKQVRVGEEGQREKQQAMEALDRAQKAGNIDAQAKAQRQAADALRDLADRLNGRDTPAARAERIAEDQRQLAKEQPQHPGGPQQQTTAKPNESPRQQARDLARQQRDLARQTQQAQQQAARQPGQIGKNAQQQALNRVAEQQQKLNQQASQLPANGRQRALEQARRAMNEAQQALARNDAAQAQQKQNEAAQALERLGQQLPQQAARPQSQQPQQGEAPPGLPSRQQADQARQLAKEQRELREAAQRLARQPVQQPAQQARQQDLQRQTADLAQQFQQLAQQSRSPQMQQGSRQAAQASQQAQQAMQQAQQQGRQGNQGQARQAQQQAAQQLDRAAQQAQQAAQQMAGQQQPGQQSGQQQSGRQAGQSVQQAQRQMGQAQQQLGQGRPQGAQNSMQQAAQSLRQAAQQLAQARQPGQPQDSTPRPSQFGAAPGGDVVDKVFAPELKKHAGKRWGELPGELRTRIMADMKAKYGDDYARIIKLYFEQIADTKR